jgi:hypothetical protein
MNAYELNECRIKRDRGSDPIFAELLDAYESHDADADYRGRITEAVELIGVLRKKWARMDTAAVNDELDYVAEMLEGR